MADEDDGYCHASYAEYQALPIARSKGRQFKEIAADMKPGVDYRQDLDFPSICWIKEGERSLHCVPVKFTDSEGHAVGAPCVEGTEHKNYEDPLVRAEVKH